MQLKEGSEDPPSCRRIQVLPFPFRGFPGFSKRHLVGFFFACAIDFVTRPLLRHPRICCYLLLFVVVVVLSGITVLVRSFPFYTSRSVCSPLEPARFIQSELCRRLTASSSTTRASRSSISTVFRRLLQNSSADLSNTNYRVDNFQLDVVENADSDQPNI
ncbi:hypothetical protein B0I37DRAFT_12507 [Chaetomium sp. MPI-CAGE-AT-0009]|nr:hypothetical protein B0I37DRAFT_12507 [Chaetomium sp. MPI-CAGE-AT-0009]